MNRRYKFILVDDIAVNNLLTKRIISLTYPGAGIVQFTEAQQALEYIQEHHATPVSGNHTILLLDIYMPVMDGWDFLKAFGELADDIKSNIKVWLLTSSISTEDMDLAKANQYVSGFYQKPFTAASAIEIVQSLNT
jgi:two-component system, chemotaxis family, chemotaxis protein CheY